MKSYKETIIDKIVAAPESEQREILSLMIDSSREKDHQAAVVMCLMQNAYFDVRFTLKNEFCTDGAVGRVGMPGDAGEPSPEFHTLDYFKACLDGNYSSKVTFAQNLSAEIKSARDGINKELYPAIQSALRTICRLSEFLDVLPPQLREPLPSKAFTEIRNLHDYVDGLECLVRDSLPKRMERQDICPNSKTGFHRAVLQDGKYYTCAHCEKSLGIIGNKGN
ncbi:hypothetical protein ABKY54_004529 [Vibrio harveyi]